MSDVYFNLFAAQSYQTTEDENHTISCDQAAAEIIIRHPAPEKLLLAALNQCGWNAPQVEDVNAALTA